MKAKHLVPVFSFRAKLKDLMYAAYAADIDIKVAANPRLVVTQSNYINALHNA